MKLTRSAARAVALRAQGLTRPSADATPAGRIGATGFLRTLGGADAYLALRARRPPERQSSTRADLDRATADGATRIVPAVRGCIYLVAADDAPWALRLADHLSRKRIAREHAKVGLDDRELETLGAAILERLADGPESTQSLRRALPDGAIRSLGDAGKKLGITSTLPPALRRLELAGAIERRPDPGATGSEGALLDSERYLWRISDDDPFADVPDDPAAVHRRVAEIFFRTAGFGDRDSFAAWSGLGKRDAAKAMDAVDLAAATVDDPSRGERDVFVPSSVDPSSSVGASSVEAAEDDARSAVAFLPFQDNLLALHDGPAFWVDPEHHGLEVPVWGRGRGGTLGDARHSTLRPIVAGGRMVGFWELDPDADDDDPTAWALFDSVDDEVRERVAEEARSVGRFLRTEIGHGHAFSLDTDAAARTRVERIRELS